MMRKRKGILLDDVRIWNERNAFFYMENNAGWHGKAPNDEEFAIAMEELKKAGEALCQK